MHRKNTQTPHRKDQYLNPGLLAVRCKPLHHSVVLGGSRPLCLGLLELEYFLQAQKNLQ